MGQAERQTDIRKLLLLILTGVGESWGHKNKNFYEWLNHKTTSDEGEPRYVLVM